MRERTGISQGRACRLMGLARRVMQYEARRSPDNEQLKQRIVELAGQRRRFGYRRIHVLLHREGQHANVKRVHRLYRQAGLQVQRQIMDRSSRAGLLTSGRTAAACN